MIKGAAFVYEMKYIFSNLTYCIDSIEISDICQNMANNKQRIYGAFIHLYYILVYINVLIIMYICIH